MSNEKPITTGKDGWHRFSVAVKPEERPGLDQAISLSGAKNLSKFMAALAMDPARTAAALAPLVAEHRAKELAANPERVRRDLVAKATQMLKEGKVSQEELERLVAGADKA